MRQIGLAKLAHSRRINWEEHNTIKKVILLQSHPSTYIKLILSTHSKKSESHHGVIIQFPSISLVFHIFSPEKPQRFGPATASHPSSGASGGSASWQTASTLQMWITASASKAKCGMYSMTCAEPAPKTGGANVFRKHTHRYIYMYIYIWYHIMILYGIIWYLGIPSGYDIARASHGIYRWPIEIDGPYRT